MGCPKVEASQLLVLKQTQFEPNNCREKLILLEEARLGERSAIGHQSPDNILDLDLRYYVLTSEWVEETTKDEGTWISIL